MIIRPHRRLPRNLPLGWQRFKTPQQRGLGIQDH
jgi:hypothetical protein